MNMITEDTLQYAEDILVKIELGNPIQSRQELLSEFVKAINLLEVAGSTDRVESLRWEASLCMQGTSTQIVHSAEKRFFTRWNTLPEAMSHYEERARHVINPVLKALYNDFVYECSPVSDKHSYAVRAINAYIESARQFAASDKADLLDDMVDALDRATFLTIQLNKRSELDQVVKILSEVIEQQSHIDLKWGKVDLPKGRWAFEPIQILFHIKNKPNFASLIDDTTLRRVQQIADELASVHATSANYLWEQNFLKMAREAALLRGENDIACQLGLRCGESIEHEAEVHANTKMAGAHLTAAAIYEKAENYYAKLRDYKPSSIEWQPEILTHYESVKRKIRNMYRFGRNEMVSVAASVEIDQEVVELMVQHLLAPSTLDECLIHIASEGALLPNVKMLTDWVEQAREKWVWTARIPQTVLSDDMSIVEAGSEAERLKLEIDRNTLMWVEMNSHIILTELFTHLREQRGMSVETLLDYFDRWGMLDEDNREIIRVGLERYFADDFVSMLHILVPQFEDVLRTLIEKAGQPVITPRKGVQGWQFETFGNLLDRDAVNKVFPSDLIAYIRIVMAEQTGWNLRNRVAHGLIRPETCTKAVADTVLHLFLILTLFRVTDSPSNEDTVV